MHMKKILCLDFCCPEIFDVLLSKDNLLNKKYPEYYKLFQKDKKKTTRGVVKCF